MSLAKYISFLLIWLIAGMFNSVIAADWLGATKDPDMGDHADFAHAMKVETRKIDDVAVVFHYGQVRPDFNELTGNDSRSLQKLSGEWQFKFDPDVLGEKEKWFEAQEGKGDADSWRKVTVPHCWDAMKEGRFWDWSDRGVSNPPLYDGAAWYQKSFDYVPGSGKRQRIVFLGVQQRARVYLNGSEVAMHEGGGAPFSVDVTEAVKNGKNTLVLKVVRLPNFRKNKSGKGWDEIKYLNTMHPVAPDCWPYAGILRDVYMIEESAVTIRKALVEVKNGDLHASLIVSNHGDTDESVSATVVSSLDPGVAEVIESFVVKSGESLVKKVVIKGIAENARVWSTSSPELYDVSAVLQNKRGVVVNRYSTKVGIREFKVDGTYFKLNGEAVFIKGASLYGEHPFKGSALEPIDHRNLFDRLEDSKSNFARMHVMQRHPYAYQLADERGIMVCGEWGGFWYKKEAMGVQTQDVNSIYQTMARCAVWDLINNPSVVMWGLNNECDQFCKEYGEFLKMARALVQELDFQKRPITWSGWHPYKGNPYFEYADAVGFNEYRGALDKFKDLDPDMKIVQNKNPNKPLIIMENGAWSKRGSRGSVKHKNNENWQADLLKRQWEVLSKYSPSFSGYTYWLLQDYRSRKPYTAKKGSNGYSRMGIYDEYGLPKLLVREAFRNLSNPLDQ